MKRFIAHIFIAFIGIIFFTLPTAAHANLIDSTPSPGTTLQTAPQTLQLTFTEPLEPAFLRLRLFDSTGAVLPLSEITVQPDSPVTATAIFPPDLPHGLYTISWRVVSAADGHATEGAFTFAIGVRFQDSSSNQPIFTVSSMAVLSRWINLWSFALLIGGIGFALFVSSDVPHHWLMVGVGGLLMLLNQAAISADVEFFSPEHFSATGQLLNGTAFSSAWFVRMGAWLGIGVLLWQVTARNGLLIAAALSLVMVYGHALTSHAAAKPQYPEAVFLDVIHVLGSSLWVGGLATFIIVLWRTRQNPDRTAIASRLTDQFSRLARLCVLALALTGLYSAWLHVGGLEPLPVTSYGRALSVKNVLLVAMLMLAAINFLMTSRRLRAGQNTWVFILNGLVVMELCLAGGVIFASAWMTSDMPAGEAYRIAQAAEAPDLSPTSFFDMQVVEDKMIHVDITPFAVGENEFIITLYNPDGSPMIDASRVGLRFTHLDNLVGESTIRAEHQGFGVYRVTGANLSVPGDWQIRLSVRQPGQFDVVTDIEVSLP